MRFLQAWNSLSVGRVKLGRAADCMRSSSCGCMLLSGHILVHVEVLLAQGPRWQPTRQQRQGPNRGTWMLCTTCMFQFCPGKAAEQTVNLPMYSSWKTCQQRQSTSQLQGFLVLPSTCPTGRTTGCTARQLACSLTCEVNELMLTMLFRQYPGFQEARIVGTGV